ncbi:ABC transporter permease subunit [Paenibacillus methanolicus]|uniref:Putative aldouronate transport system permease protein n=1 Tax=Paenibacillus methanolicus TaxID=582686 RepID=A0A5S5CJE5_9BACL|nr:ABC transporter permease subunit [Paenibacillus methanolicus]TYP79860.1 putative aldouronate transport system permease protein [Paenibacillus methanolicus]
MGNIGLWFRKEWKHLRKNRELLLLAAPGVLFKFVIAYIPMVGLILAFKFYRYDEGIFGSRWVGFDNFEFLVKSQDALRVIRNTLAYNFVYIVLGTVTALLFALLLNELTGRMVKLYQTTMFLPFFISFVLVGYIGNAFLDHENGFANNLLTMLGFEPRNWYFETGPWLFILPLVSIWKGVGFSTLVYYAGITGISSDYYEAARLDGATRIQMMLRITLPLLKPLIIILFILGLGNIFRGDFGLHYFVPNNVGMNYATTDVIDTYIFRALTKLADINSAAAVGFLQSVVGLVTVIGANYLVRRIDKDSALF